MVVRNQTLCETMNKMRFCMLDSGYAIIDKDPNWTGTVTNPTFSRFYYILRGDFYIVGEDGKEQVLSAGNCYLLPAEYSFRFGCRDTVEHIYFHITLGDFDGIDMLKSCPAPIGCAFPPEKTETYRHLTDTQSILDCLRAKQEVYTSIYTLFETHRIILEKKEYSPSVQRQLSTLNPIFPCN